MLFPACAGVILSTTAARYILTAFPRVCGGDPEADGVCVFNDCFSPRVRG